MNRLQCLQIKEMICQKQIRKSIGNLWSIFQIFSFNEKIENDSERNFQRQQLIQSLPISIVKHKFALWKESMATVESRFKKES